MNKVVNYFYAEAHKPYIGGAAALGWQYYKRKLTGKGIPEQLINLQSLYTLLDIAANLTYPYGPAKLNTLFPTNKPYAANMAFIMFIPGAMEINFLAFADSINIVKELSDNEEYVIKSTFFAGSFGLIFDKASTFSPDQRVVELEELFKTNIQNMPNNIDKRKHIKEIAGAFAYFYYIVDKLTDNRLSDFISLFPLITLEHPLPLYNFYSFVLHKTEKSLGKGLEATVKESLKNKTIEQYIEEFDEELYLEVMAANKY
jgi:hypothetical protein